MIIAKYTVPGAQKNETKTKQSKTKDKKQNKTKQNNTIQNKTKQNKLNKKQTNKKYTRLGSHPTGKKRNQTDFTLSNQRGIVTNCEVITKAEIGSDHRLVRMTLRINKRLARLKTIKKQKPFNINTQKLRGMKEIFDINLKKNRFEKLEGGGDSP